MLGAVSKIGEPCQSPFNAGFLTHLYLVRTEDAVYVNSPTGNSISQTVQAAGINVGSVITELVIRPRTAVFSEVSSENGDGISYLASLSVPMKGTAAELTNWVHQNNRRRYLIFTRDTLGYCYMLGSMGNGARVSWTRQVNAQSLHQLAFTLLNWHPVQFIPTIDLQEVFPDSEFDYSFDLSFS